MTSLHSASAVPVEHGQSRVESRRKCSHTSFASGSTAFNNSSISPSHPSCQFSLAAWVVRNPIWWSSSLVISSDTGCEVHFFQLHIDTGPRKLSLCLFVLSMH